MWERWAINCEKTVRPTFIHHCSADATPRNFGRFGRIGPFSVQIVFRPNACYSVDDNGVAGRQKVLYRTLVGCRRNFLGRSALDDTPSVLIAARGTCRTKRSRLGRWSSDPPSEVGYVLTAFALVDRFQAWLIWVGLRIAAAAIIVVTGRVSGPFRSRIHFKVMLLGKTLEAGFDIGTQCPLRGECSMGNVRRQRLNHFVIANQICVVDSSVPYCFRQPT